ncbi:DUF5988 family protein [Streptomyces sp. NPDC096012]|uniref:DUF5988 family protein n=1 Tax=Streptomyces sp. NPDC096012 TaxID=3155684 RepID=UPI00336A19E9
MASRCFLPSFFPLLLASERPASPHTGDDRTPRTAGPEERKRKSEGRPARRSQGTLKQEVPNSCRVILSGGPDWAEIPAVWEVASLESEPKVKLLCGNAYEHFEFSGLFSVHEGQQLPVYRWCRRTYVAE